MPAKPDNNWHRARSARSTFIARTIHRIFSIAARLRNLVFAAALFGSVDLVPAAPPAPDVKATQTDAFPAHPDSRAREGDTITYTTVISNVTGAADATGVQLLNPTPGNTTDVAGSITISPLAFPDAYTAGQDIELDVAAAQGVLVNDKGLPTPTAVAVTAAPTTQGGTVDISTDGSFKYHPPSGFFGTDTFTYTVTNANTPDDSSTVTITVVKPPIAVPDPYSANKDATLNVPAAQG